MVQQRPKLLLILDLDETLIHSSRVLLDPVHDFEVLGYYVYKRPFLDEFIRQMGEHFQLAVWSAASAEYVEQVAGLLFPVLTGLAFLWDKAWTSARELSQPAGKNGLKQAEIQFVKQLARVEQLGFSREHMLLLDDTEYNIHENAGNAIHIRAFRGDPADRELLRLSKLLIHCKDCEDVRKIDWLHW